MLNVSQSYQRAYSWLTISVGRILFPTQTQDELLGLIVDDNIPADETIIITSEDDIIIIDNEIKR